MIGYNRLGSNGRLGNQMFQYAALRGIAAKNGYDFTIPPEDYPHRDNYGLFETFKLMNVKTSNIGFVEGNSVQENGHQFIEEFFTQLPDDVNLEGYFQTEKYFSHIKNEILQDFQFNEGYSIPCKQYIASLDTPPIFLHIRQSDNIGREQYHPILPLSYFERALEEFPEDTPCFVFTDDIAWCKKQEFFKADRFLFNESNERYSYQTVDGTGNRQNTLLPQTDLCLMSMCSGAIIANSSMSWWGAWLQNGRGKVVAPKMWFGPAYPTNNTKDLYCENWIVI